MVSACLQEAEKRSMKLRPAFGYIIRPCLKTKYSCNSKSIERI
jgi:hypothetical protein